MGQDLIEHRQIITHGFSGSSRGYNAEVFSFSSQIQSPALVSIQPVNPFSRQHLRNAFIQGVRKSTVMPFRRRHRSPIRDIFHKRRVIFQPLEQLVKVHLLLLFIQAGQGQAGNTGVSC